MKKQQCTGTSRFRLKKVEMGPLCPPGLMRERGWAGGCEGQVTGTGGKRTPGG